MSTNDRTLHLGQQLIELSRCGQKCDVTFFKKPPAINVKIDQKINYALMYGAGAKKLIEMLSKIELSNGDTVNISDIWVINPMPPEELTDKHLATVDLAGGDVVAGPNGETIREMISETYHCTSPEEEEKYLRRFLAS